MVIVGAMAVGLVAFLIYLVIMRPHPTPFIPLAVTSYESPAPVNAWALEDINRFRDTGNLKLPDELGEWRSSEDAKQGILPAGLSLESSRRDVPVIFYISAHGVVNDQDEACLLPPGKSVLEPDQWLRVSDLLDEILSDKRLGDRRNVLVIFDSTRIRANWGMGILYNSFVERLRELVYARDSDRLAVLVSASPGEISWTSAEFGGSVFGRYLQLGLAGDAVEHPGFWHSQVMLRELAAYLAREVNAWTKFNRGETQTPLLIAADGVDFRLTSARSAKALRHSLSTPEERKPEVSAEDLAPAWAKYQQLLEPFDMLRLDPIACRQIEHELLRIEELCLAGAAYSEKAKSRLNELNKSLDKALTRAKAADESAALATHLGVFNRGEWAVQAEAAHSLPVGEYFGSINREQSQVINDYLIRYASGRDAENLSNRLNRVAISLIETQVLKSARDQNVAKLWRPQIEEILYSLRTTAESLSIPSSPSGGPGDERAHYIARATAEQADRARRLAEDMLFVGEQNAGAGEFDRRATEATGLYEKTRAEMDSAAKAFRTRDQAAAVTPYLAARICNRLYEEADTGLLEFIRMQRSLGQQSRQLGGAKNGAFQALAQQVQAKLDAYRTRYDEECTRLSNNDAVGVVGLRAIESVLMTPLIPGDIRTKLLARHAAISSELFSDYFKDKAKIETEVEEEGIDDTMAQPPIAVDYVERITAWKKHPILELLQIPEAKDNDEPWKHFESVATQVRERLALLQSAPDVSNYDGQNESADAQREPLSRDELRLRVAAALTHTPVGVNPAGSMPDAVENLRRFDVQQLLVWLSKRAADDFWGAAEASNEEFSFAQVIDDYMEAARVIGAVDEVWRREPAGARQISDLLTARQQAKRDGLKIRGRSSLRISRDSTANVQIDVNPIAPPVDYPAGRAAIFLRDGGKRLSDVRVASFVPNEIGFLQLPTKTSERHRFNAEFELSPNVNNLQSVVYFRGQVAADEFAVRSLGGIQITYDPHQYQEQSITLGGNKREKLSIVFVLDCSGSMSAETDNAAEGGGSDGISRFERAKRALVAMLKEVARRNAAGADIHVGVWLFGHRLNWRDNKSAVILRSPSYTHKIPNNLSPNEDIEEVRSLGEFRDTNVKDVEIRLTKVKPWGRTPLYRAMVGALNKNFHEVALGTRPVLVVITDGADDDDDSPPESPIPVPEGMEVNDVLEVSEQRRVPIHILGFNLGPDAKLGITPADVAAAKREYSAIAQQSGGSYADATTGGQLLQRLREQLDDDTYSVQSLSNPTRRPPTNSRGESPRLNDKVPIRSLELPAEEFEVRFRSAAEKVKLEGGEALALRISQGDENIEAVPYDDGIASQQFLTKGAGGSPSNLLFRAHNPVIEKKGEETAVSFKLSLQRSPETSEHFTERPRETWVEITPILDDNKPAQPYVFYDQNLEPNEPVPVLIWTARGWPNDASRARVRIWCKFEPTREEILSLSELKLGQFEAVPGEPRMQFKVERTVARDEQQIYIEEQHSDASPGIDAIRLRLASGPRQHLKRVEHRFDAQERVVTHRFQFVGLPNANALQGVTIAIARERDVKNAAFQLPEGGALEVSVGGGGSAFSVDAAAGGR